MKNIISVLLLVVILCGCETPEEQANKMLETSRELISERKYENAAKLLRQLLADYQSTDAAQLASQELKKVTEVLAESADKRARSVMSDFSTTLFNYLSAKGSPLSSLSDLDFDGQALPFRNVPEDIVLLYLQGQKDMHSIVFCYAENGMQSYIIENADTPSTVKRWTRLPRDKMSKRFTSIINDTTVAEEYKGAKRLVKKG